MKKVYPPTYLIACLLLSVLPHYLLPWQVINVPYNYGGAFLIFLGICLNLWADMLLKKSKTTVKPDEKPAALITGGPYGLSRHPMYLGMTLVLLGAATYLGSIASFVGPALFIAAMETFFIPLEERRMRETFGGQYDGYCRKVRKWL